MTQVQRPAKKVGSRPSLRARFRYRFDSAIARGTGRIILWMAAMTVALVFVAAVILTIFDVGVNEDTNPTLLERFWQAFLRILDPGTFSGDDGWPLRITTLLVTLLGVVIGAALIGLIVAAVETKLDELRRGRSFVVEQGHTLILGWSPRVYTLISEIVVANQNQPRGCIVVLSGEEKMAMEQLIRDRVGDTGTTKVVCRTGDPSSPNDLDIVNVSQARSVVVLAGGADENVGDAEAVKAVLAVMSGDPDLERCAVVAELTDEETARALREASAGRVITVRAADVIARITAQACRQAGLSLVCRDLLDFGGDEIYFNPAPELAGHTFGEALLAYEESSIIGRQAADGAIKVHPPMETRFEDGDAVIAVAEDDDTVVFSGFRDEDAGDVVMAPAPPDRPEHLLMVGWNPLGPIILRELDQFVPPESTVDVLADTDLVESTDLVDVQLDNLVETFRPTHGDLDQLTTFVGEHSYDKVIILGYRSGLSPEEADSRTLLTLLLLQRALGSDGERRSRIVTELLDSRDVELARATGADDFVVSDELSSLLMAQLSERAELEPVLSDLFDVEGSALALQPAAWYLQGRVTYAQVVAAARARSEIAIGFRIDEGADGKPEIVMNPPKSRTVKLGEHDQVIVIAPV
ncbi:MAG: potassium transporter TrkA [Actinobacteria bacterium]|nr:potassium transporter TrkA [Actinomycetota bacterium]